MNLPDPFVIDFTMWTNTNFSYRLTFADAATGLPLDLSGKAFAMNVKVNAADVSATTAATIDFAGVANGIVGMGIPAGAIAAGLYVYDLIMFDAGSRERMGGGRFTVIQGVTQP